MNKSIFFFAAFMLALGFTACKKETDKTMLQVYMTDGPGDYQKVNVDIQEIRVKTSDDTSAWLLLNTNAGIYDLLTLQNGVDTLIAFGQIPAVTLKEVRFILGDDNTVMVDSVVYPLITPSAEQSGLKVKVDKNLSADLNTLTLDFDAQASIVKQGNGNYLLKPVIRVK